MEVWDPKDKPTVLSQIKTFINAHIRGFLVSRYLYYPGKWLYEWFLRVCETYGSSISCWPGINVGARETDTNGRMINGTRVRRAMVLV